MKLLYQNLPSTYSSYIFSIFVTDTDGIRRNLDVIRDRPSDYRAVKVL